MANIIQFRRDTNANWVANNPILAQGELGLVIDTGAYKVGDGVTAWNSLSSWALPATVNTLTMNTQSDPSTPSANTLNLYARGVCGRQMPKWIGPSGLSTPAQPALFQNSIWLVQPSVTSAVSYIGGSVSSAGTISHPAPSTSTYGLCANFATAATVNATGGTGHYYQPFFTGADNVGGGFFFVSRLTWPDVSYGSGSTGSRFFVGLTDQSITAAVTSDNPAGNRMCFAMSTNLGETDFMLSTAAGTGTEARVDTGVAFVPQNLYDFYLFFPPGGTTLNWRIDNLTTGTSTGGSTSTSIPGPGVMLRAGFQIATLTTTARNIRMKKIYVETDQ